MSMSDVHSKLSFTLPLPQDRVATMLSVWEMFCRRKDIPWGQQGSVSAEQLFSTIGTGGLDADGCALAARIYNRMQSGSVPLEAEDRGESVAGALGITLSAEAIHGDGPAEIFIRSDVSATPYRLAWFITAVLEEYPEASPFGFEWADIPEDPSELRCFGGGAALCAADTEPQFANTNYDIGLLHNEYARLRNPEIPLDEALPEALRDAHLLLHERSQRLGEELSASAGQTASAALLEDKLKAIEEARDELCDWSERLLDRLTADAPSVDAPGPSP